MNIMKREMEDTKKNQMELLELKNISDVKNPLYRIINCACYYNIQIHKCL